jgi:hypothetical protein
MHAVMVFVLSYVVALACVVALTGWPTATPLLVVVLTVPAIVGAIIIVE